MSQWKIQTVIANSSSTVAAAEEGGGVVVVVPADSPANGGDPEERGEKEIHQYISYVQYSNT